MKMSEVKIVDVEQGSERWHEERALHDCASDAPVMMGDSKVRSRRELLHEKHTGQSKEISGYVQDVVFAEGHKTEAEARKIVELDLFEDLTPAVVAREVDGLMLMASLDGWTDDHKLLFEHKQWNAVLADNVKNQVLEPAHYWQLEHQLLASGAEQVLFVVSDGTEDKMVKMLYQSTKRRRSALIAGWHQFAKDREVYEPEAKQEVVVGASAEAFPVITYKVDVSMVESNIADVLPIIKERAEIEMNRVLDTDQDFADKENLNKATKATREKLKEIVASAEGEFVSFSEFAATAEQIDAILQKMQSQGEKQVKQAKEKKKRDMANDANADLVAYIGECNSKIKPLLIGIIMNGGVNPDFEGAMKNKRTIESLKNAVDGVVAAAKIEIDQVMANVVPNQIYLREHAKDYSFLFADVSQIINQAIEPFQAIVKSRIAEHKASAEKKIKSDALIKSWEDAKQLSAESKELHIVNDEFLFIKQSKCDKDLFGDDFPGALATYQDCFAAIESNLKELKKAAEETPEPAEEPKESGSPVHQKPTGGNEAPNIESKATKTVEEVVETVEQTLEDHVDEIASEVATSTTEPATESKSTLLGDLEEWAMEYNVSTEATDALNAILMRHCS